MDWKEYEELVFQNIKEIFSDSECIYNSNVLGKYSKGLRQCDVIVNKQLNGENIKILIDAKYYSEKIDVKAVEMFISMANDIGAQEAILVTPLGYSQLAYERAENDPSNILLDILNIKELKQLQGSFAIPYAGKHGVILRPAFGWVIDAKRRFRNLAFSYRKGFDFDFAWKEKEFIYFNIWDLSLERNSKIELLKKQEEMLRETEELVTSEVKIIHENNKEIALRKTIIKNYLAPEYACAIEHDGFIFFGVMISENNRESVNLRKLIQMISMTIPIEIENKTNVP